MKQTKYNYPRVDLTLRVSMELHHLINQACVELRVTSQDLLTSFILNQLDITKANCPDWNNIPLTLH